MGKLKHQGVSNESAKQLREVAFNHYPEAEITKKNGRFVHRNTAKRERRKRRAA